MTRGTTPDIIATLTGVDLSDVVVLYVTLQQGSVVVEKNLDEVIIDGSEIHVTLTQEETLSFTANTEVKMQVRGLMSDGRAFATNIRTATVKPILKEGVIECNEWK